MSNAQTLPFGVDDYFVFMGTFPFVCPSLIYLNRQPTQAQRKDKFSKKCTLLLLVFVPLATIVAVSQWGCNGNVVAAVYSPMHGANKMRLAHTKGFSIQFSSELPGQVNMTLIKYMLMNLVHACRCCCLFKGYAILLRKIINNLFRYIMLDRLSIIW
jgi:hypothetical protein